MKILPIELERIIFKYMDDMLLFEKLTLAYTEFMRYFSNIYAPISEGQMSSRPSIFNNFANSDNWGALEIRFRKAEVVFNHYCWTMNKAAPHPNYWIQKAIETIRWNGVALMLRGQEIEFIKLHGKFPGEDSVLSENGYTIINLADFGDHVPVS